MKLVVTRSDGGVVEQVLPLMRMKEPREKANLLAWRKRVEIPRLAVPVRSAPSVGTAAEFLHVGKADVIDRVPRSLRQVEKLLSLEVSERLGEVSNVFVGQPSER